MLMMIGLLYGGRVWVLVGLGRWEGVILCLFVEYCTRCRVILGAVY